MAGTSKTRAQMQAPTYSAVASAVRYKGKVPRIYQAAEEWQKEAYRHYNICGEARFAANYFGHSLGRATLFASQDIKTQEALTDGAAVEALDALFHGGEGQEQMLTAIGIHLTVAGCCYVVGRTEVDEEGEEHDVWEVVSVTEVQVAGTVWRIADRETPGKFNDLSEDDVVIRVWRPHPEHRMQADSPFRSLLPILTEIEWLTRHIFAQCSSRLAGAGLLFLSQGIEMPPPPSVDGKPQDIENKAQGLMLALAEGMLRPLEDPSSPESLVPLIATVPEEVMKSGKIAELMHFWTELDAASLEMRNAALHRFALGMDMPPEQILGMGSNPGSGGGTSNGVSHWGAWQIDEATIKLHVEPMLGLVCNSLTIGYLRPATDGFEVLRYDTKKLRLRPDRSKEALELWKMGLLNSKRTLEENGFSEEDMPDEAERRVWILMRMASGSATPEQVAQAANMLGVEVPMPTQPAQDTREARPLPSTQDLPTRDLPERPSASLLLAATEPLVLRALERAGNRLRQKGMRPPGVPSYETHTVVQANGQTASIMEDAFPTAAICLNGIAEADQVVPVLESYVTTLLAEQKPHERERLNQWLQMAGVDA